ncbi:MAG TPA: NAD-dependent epimerase/dehydratase family protein [Candidatus Eisenbergiella merdipullorum]|uniref:NAD-dependent epimerase/dehydratase family protein n=1 Tax=Candidatus Eisenbergiella merdipullorum TaxID=2838553 RepID=A0A9D2L0A9_9FIRM|nr:NAD-dependent epimerase/dehydratase family protein [Candidatus Eisenbergiella merdipullorum]
MENGNDRYADKQVLLIGGGGTLGTYVSEELLKLGCFVDIICPEEKSSQNERLRFYREYATEAFLKELLAHKRYDGIVNFIHYPEVEDYRPFHQLLSEHTDQLIFLSSYRVYADLQHPITEEAPQLLDVIRDDEDFIKNEKYALSKARCENYLRRESKTKNWTIVRPVISFSDRRFDLVTISGHEVIDAAREGRPILLPEAARDLTAGLDWAGNTGKLIAHLLFKKECLGQAYTVSSAQNLTWGEVADIYARLLNVRIEWVDTDTYIRTGHGGYILTYDRLYDRAVDNSKILKAAGLKKEDFVSIEDGIRIELAKV